MKGRPTQYQGVWNGSERMDSKMSMEMFNFSLTLKVGRRRAVLFWRRIMSQARAQVASRRLGRFGGGAISCPI